MLNLKLVLIGIISGVAFVFILGAAERNGKKGPRRRGCSNSMLSPTLTARQ